MNHTHPTNPNPSGTIDPPTRDQGFADHVKSYLQIMFLTNKSKPQFHHAIEIPGGATSKLTAPVRRRYQRVVLAA